MFQIFKRIAKLLEKYPMKSIFITIIVVVLLVIGVRNVYMATGNDTLVKSSTDVYKDNLMLEEEFGGESVIVLYESDNLLTTENLHHMKGIEETIRTSDSIYSILSPVTLVEEIAQKQSDTFQEGIEEIIDGLDTMGTKLTEIGAELSENAHSDQTLELPAQDGLALPDFGEAEFPEFNGIALPEFGEPELPQFGEIKLPDMEEQLAELNEGFMNLIGEQENLGKGTEGLVNGYAQFGTQTKELANNLAGMAEQMGNNPQLTEQAQKLQGVSTGLNEMSGKMIGISEDTAELPSISTKTINGLQNMQEKLTEQLQGQQQQQEEMQREQKQLQENMQQKLAEEQAAKEAQMKKQMEQQVAEQKKMQANMKKEQKQKQAEIKDEMLAQQEAKEAEMELFKTEMQEKMDEQADNLSTLADGLTEMGENLLTISENMEMIHVYSDIMTPGLPTKQATLDNIVYGEDDKLRPMFEEVIVDEQYMLMMIRFQGETTDSEKSEIVATISDYLAAEQLDSVETLVSGKPVLDDAIRSSMQSSMQVMIVLALVFMIIVLFLVFNVRWRLLSLATVLTAVIATVGAMGWLNIPITMVSMAVFPILIGLGIDYGIQFQNRYTEEMNREEVAHDEQK